MKKLLLLLFLPFLGFSQYDEDLAQKIGADDYGMKTYVMAFLYAGPNRAQPKEEADKLQRAHLDNINRMAEEGTLIIAGPFYENKDKLQGIYIFNVATVEEAQKLTETDPAIKAGRLRMELVQWYGPAALMLLKDLHQKVTKKDI